MEIKYKDIKRANEELNAMRAKRYYENKYYGLFMNAYKFKPLSDQENHYLLKRFWKDGTINAFIIEDTKIEENQNGQICFTPYATHEFNIYDFPTKINAINVRNAKFIPAETMTNNVDCVIGWANVSHVSVRDMVMFYVEKIVEVEQTIDTALFNQKLPRLAVCSTDDIERVKKLMEDIDAGKKRLFLEVDDYNAIKNVLSSGGEFNIDKLFAYKQSLECELLTYLGIDNITFEKKERLIVDEANANNEVINDNGDCFLSAMREFCNNVNDILGYPLSVMANSTPATATHEESEDNDNVD